MTMALFSQITLHDGGLCRVSLNKLSDVGLERLRKVSASYKAENSSLDFGFKAFRLSPSNVRAWVNYEGSKVNELNDLFSANSTTLVDGWKEPNVLTEIALMEGFRLDSRMSVSEEFEKNKVFKISSPEINHCLFVCLDETLAPETMKLISQSGLQNIFVVLDSSLNDEAKVGYSDALNIKTL